MLALFSFVASPYCSTIVHQALSGWRAVILWCLEAKRISIID